MKTLSQHGLPLGDPAWLDARTIFVTLAGSRAYGLATEQSDVDLRGIAIEPTSTLLGYDQPFEQKVFQPAEEGDADGVIFGLRKFFRLSAQCNPNALELLYTEPQDHLRVCAPMDRLLERRDDFLSLRAVHTFRGYAIGQLKRIRSHRRWLLSPPKAPPTRARFGLPERTLIPRDQLMAAQAAVQKKLDGWEIDFGGLVEASKIHIQEQVSGVLAELQITSDARWQSAARSIGLSENFLALMDRERRYKAAANSFRQYTEWKAKRNPKRAAIEAKYGYDCKHASHLVRLLRMCRELLAEHVLRVRRPDADELRAIRDGAWSYNELVAHADAENEELLALAEQSTLPRAPDSTALNALCVEMTEIALAEDWRATS